MQRILTRWCQAYKISWISLRLEKSVACSFRNMLNNYTMLKCTSWKPHKRKKVFWMKNNSSIKALILFVFSLYFHSFFCWYPWPISTGPSIMTLSYEFIYICIQTITPTRHSQLTKMLQKTKQAGRVAATEKHKLYK